MVIIFTLKVRTEFIFQKYTNFILTSNSTKPQTKVADIVALIFTSDYIIEVTWFVRTKSIACGDKTILYLFVST